MLLSILSCEFVWCVWCLLFWCIFCWFYYFIQLHELLISFPLVCSRTAEWTLCGSAYYSEPSSKTLFVVNLSPSLIPVLFFSSVFLFSKFIVFVFLSPLTKADLILRKKNCTIQSRRDSKTFMNADISVTRRFFVSFIRVSGAGEGVSRMIVFAGLTHGLCCVNINSFEIKHSVFFFWSTPKELFFFCNSCATDYL